MIRAFKQHHIRSTQSLDGWWDFTTANTGKPTPGKEPASYDQQINVPSTWEQIPGLERHRGQAGFRKSIHIDQPADHATRIVFAGVSHTGTAFIDGKKLARHEDAYTPFDALAANLKNGNHKLTVHVDNSFGDHACLHKPNDYFTYGGITRPVEIQAVPQVYINRVAATPQPARQGKWNLELRIDLKNWSSKSLKRSVHVQLEGHTVKLNDVTIPAKSEISVAGKLANISAKPWSPTSPNLYYLNTTLLDGETPVDDLIDRVGFRTVAVKGKKLLFNGKPIRPRGYNRHEDHPQFGCAIPPQAMITDLQIIRDLGCNFVRTSHYPNDQRFLDLCDEMGFYVWEESHARQVDMDHPKFAQQIDDSTREMIQWHHNHPSIIMWGILNECDSSNPKQTHHYKRLLNMIKTMDPSRPTTFASDRRDQELCFGMADIVSVNRYIGWGGHKDKVESTLKEWLRWLNSDKSHGAKNKPVILSEFGAGAIPGYHPRHMPQWSEQFQRDVLDAELAVYLHHPQVIGAIIWQFCDIRITTEGIYFGQRPRCMNNKGTVDEFRRPKLSYDVVKKHMLDAAARYDSDKPAKRATKKR